MQFQSVRWRRSLILGAVIACGTFGVTASSALAWGDGDHDSYTANISPSTVQNGTSTTFDVALTNTSSPGSGLSSALLTPPPGFRVTGASLNGAPGHAYVIFNLVVLDRLNVPAGSTVHVAVTATAPSSCGSPYTRWFTYANEGGLWSDQLRLDSSSSSLTTSVTCDVATGLQFVGQPTNTAVGQTITGTGPGVTVELVDAGGNVVDTSAPVTVAVGTNPSNGNLGGTLTENASHGIATFGDLSLDKPGAGYTLTATSPAVSGGSATSNAFTETQTETVDCPAAGCTNTLSTGESSAQVVVDPGTSDASLTESVDLGTPMDGTGSDPKNVGCATYTPRAADWYGVDVSDSNRGKTITWTVNNAISDGFEICFGAPYDFQTGFGVDGGPTFAPAGILPDGTTGFVGLLDSCNNLGDAQSTNPCWTSIVPGANGSGTVATIRIPSGVSGDPYFGR